MTELQVVVGQYYKLLQYKRRIDQELKKLRQQILEELRNPGIYTIGDCTVKISRVKQRRLDTNKLKEFLGESYDEFLTEVEIVRLDVNKNTPKS